MNDNKIRSIDQEGFLKGILPHLDFLDLSDNNLQNLPKKLSKYAQKLKKLFLSRNAISDIPEEFYDIDSLEVLHLNGNRFEKLSKNLINLKNLQIFNLDWFNYLPFQVETPITKG